MKGWLLALGSLFAFTAAAQYPDKPIHIIVPYAPGAMGETVTRLLIEQMRGPLGQPLVVESRAGAAGNIGTAAVANAAPDGYTVLVAGTNNFVINQYVYSGMGFDPMEKLAPVTILVDVPSVLFISGKLPAQSLAGFVQYARANKGKLNYGSPGAGSPPHLSAALISQTRDLGMVHVPYQGAAPAVQALLAGDIHMYLVGAGQGLPYVKSGAVRALAVSAPERLAVLPDTPTFKEAGLGDIKASVWWGAAVPKGTSPEVVKKLYEAFRAALASDVVHERFKKLGIMPVGTPPEETARQMQEEARYWAKAVKTMNIRLD